MATARRHGTQRVDFGALYLRVHCFSLASRVVESLLTTCQGALVTLAQTWDHLAPGWFARAKRSASLTSGGGRGRSSPGQSPDVRFLGQAASVLVAVNFRPLLTGDGARLRSQ